MATKDALAAYAIRPLLTEEDCQCDCSEEALTARASTITLVLGDILSKGYAFPQVESMSEVRRESLVRIKP